MLSFHVGGNGAESTVISCVFEFVCVFVFLLAL